jgi:hypothetical protein
VPWDCSEVVVEHAVLVKYLLAMAYRRPPSVVLPDPSDLCVSKIETYPTTHSPCCCSDYDSG